MDNLQNRAVTRFQAILLPQAEPIIPTLYTVRPDFIAAYNILASITPANPNPAMAPLVTASANVASDPATITRANHWVDNALNTVESVLPPIPHGTVGFVDDILYIVTTPEFALNGYDEPGVVRKWNMKGTMPLALEDYIRDRILFALMTDRFKQFHILFTFSCCTYTPTIVDFLTPTRVPILEKRIGFTNSITVLCIDSAQNGIDHWKVAKAAINPADGLFSWGPGPDFITILGPERKWDEHGDPVVVGPNVISRTRFEETNIALKLKDASGQPLCLGFQTCQDIENPADKRRDASIVILSGSGAPFVRSTMQNTTHPFLCNDTDGWSVWPGTVAKPGLARLRAVGYYQFRSTPPVPGCLSVMQRTIDGNGIDGIGLNVAMSKCYLYPPPHQSVAGLFTTAETNHTPITVPVGAAANSLYIRTDVIQLPPKTSNSKDCTIL